MVIELIGALGLDCFLIQRYPILMSPAHQNDINAKIFVCKAHKEIVDAISENKRNINMLALKIGILSAFISQALSFLVKVL